MAQDQVYDVAVLGAGVVGSATAYYLTSKGTVNVLLLEQFDANHTRGSSHGGSRITRKAYPKPYYVQMMKDAFKMWEEIEAKSKKQLYLKTGILMLGDQSDPDPEYQCYLDSMKECGVPYEIYTASEANKKYPNQLKLPESFSCVIEHDGGILIANKALATLQELFISNGGDFRENHKVTKIIPGPVVTVVTEKTTFKAKKLILTAGPWTNKLLQPTGLTLPLTPQRVEAVYWRAENPQWYKPDEFPVFAYCLTDKLFYGIPILEYPGLLKICNDKGVEIDPDDRDKEADSVTIPVVKEFIDCYLKGVDYSSPAVLEYCIITKTPDDDAIIDKHPQHPNIIIGAGLSGHGFKESPVVGKMLTELALGGPLSYDLSPYRIGRFNKDM